MTKIRTGEILCVGTELLIGQTLNTNATWLAKELSALGINSYYQTVVGDNEERMKDAMLSAIKRSDLLVTSGGLGPTEDDITLAVIAKVAQRKILFHQETMDWIEQYFQNVHAKMTANIKNQAFLPEGAKALINTNGTASGIILEFEYQGQNKTIIALPGPPMELQTMFKVSVEAWLKKRSQYRLKHRFIHMIDIGESRAEEKLIDLIEQQKNPTLAPYASEGEVCFRVTQLMQTEEEQDNTVDLIKEIQSRLGSYIYEIGPRSMGEVLKDLLIAKQKYISFAESCTGGQAASNLTDIPGSSECFKGSIVAYANQIKQEVLGVNPEILENDGAVSEHSALAMAAGAQRIFSSDVAIAITGIAGPDGGTKDKPVGTVWLAGIYEDKKLTRCLQLSGSRQKIRKIAVLQAYNLARKLLLGEISK